MRISRYYQNRCCQERDRQITLPVGYPRRLEIKTDEESHTEYAYQEEVIWWALPLREHVERVNGRQVLTDAGRQYIADHADEITEWAMTAGV